MKKTIFLFSLVAGLFVANAQTTANATLNVKLEPFQSITINSTPTVDMTYTNAADYSDGVEVAVTDHLSVSGSGGFFVFVSVPSDDMAGSNTAGGISETMDAAAIKIVAENGTGTTDGVFAPLSSLTTTTAPGAVLLSSPTGGSNKLFTVKYKGADGDAFLGKRIGPGTTTYTTQVVYTVTAN